MTLLHHVLEVDLGWPHSPLRHPRGQGVATTTLTPLVLLQEAEKGHPDLLQLPQDLEQPSQAAG